MSLTHAEDNEGEEFNDRPELVRKRARSIFWQRLGVVTVAIFMIISIAILVLNAVESIHTRQRLLDCTDPHGSCYQQGQQSGQSVIKEIEQTIIFANACADQPGVLNEQEMKKCVEAKLGGK